MQINKIYNGTCLEVLKTLPDNSIDSCVTDPPYGISFMNKHWDYDIPKAEVWKEVLRVLKPGGHILCACGTRTQHRMAVNIEDAGFEIRDVITWHYGSGFPKSLDISKAIDKRSKISHRLKEFSELLCKKRNELKLTIAEADKLVTGGSTMYSFLEGRNLNGEERIYAPNKIHYENIKTHFGVEGWDDIVENNLEVVGEQEGNFGYQKNGERWNENTATTATTTDAAKQWEGWGTALKPATEFWTLARKPLSEKTVAENVLKYGTGGINIDGSRIDLDGEQPPIGSAKRVFKSNSFTDEKIYGENKETSSLGRFPANIILDEEAGKLLDEQTGILSSGTPSGLKAGNNNNVYGQYAGDIPVTGFSDSGGASRYFLNIKNGGINVFFTYLYYLINTEISCGNILENQKAAGIVNGVTMEIEKYTLSVSQFISGSKPTENYQKDTKSTIEILTRLMTELKTCNFLQGMNIEWYTQEQTKTINSLMELNIENANLVTNINYLANLHVEMLEHIRDIVSRVQQRIFKSGEIQTENGTTNTTENTESRFIYTPKADNYERNKGLKGFDKGEPPASARSKAAEGRENALGNPRANHHPTVKPIDLMRYLVKLITPKKGICLDPYCGSGTTLIGCKMELINYIGIEREEEYCKIAEARVAAWNPDRYIEQTLF